MSDLTPDQKTSLAEFINVTDTTEPQARFHLEASQWSLQSALAQFFENNGGDSDEFEETATATQTANAAPVKPEKTPKQPNRFGTVAGLNKDSSSDEEEGQAFYAGGSTTSGQQVLGPGKKKTNIVAQMFRSVQEHGGEVVDTQDTQKRKSLSFSGTGYRLGQTDSDSQAVQGPSGGRREVIINLRMWRDGFSINDGPLRLYTSPESREFLRTVASGEIPAELRAQAREGEVHLNMEDHSDETYENVKPKLSAFTGKGNVLGSPVPGSDVSTPVVPSAPSEREAGEIAARQAANVNESQPVTTLQVRLSDASRLIITLNHSHTVGDLRSYITTSRPEYTGQSFRLLTTFPNKELTDDKATLSEAGLLNATIIQRL